MQDSSHNIVALNRGLVRIATQEHQHGWQTKSEILTEISVIGILELAHLITLHLQTFQALAKG